ncbi:MAG: glycosyltransferase family 4 protein [Opitutaceae bacterium]|nr:glycosyltransferase family 4 protein [Opitutaceae bacterium]
MLLLDLSHTSHTQARTGIQRVCRNLHAALGDEAAAVTWDPYAGRWRQLDAGENACLAATAPSARRGARWPWTARLRGRWQRLAGAAAPALPAAAGVIVPELFSPAVGAALPTLFAGVAGPKVALFHDAIALRFPELSPAGTVARFPAYLQELLAFDGIAAVSADSRDALVDYWRWLGRPVHPPVIALPLALELCHAIRDKAPAAGAPVVLCVGSLEGRKNHVTLFAAAERLWAQGRQFRLQVIGLAHPQTGRAAQEKMQALQAAGRPLEYLGPVDDTALEQAYAACTFTVYPSLAEGFGLPVLESLARGKPCLCSGRGALGEAARDGGCLTLDRVDDPAALAAAMDRLLTNPAERATLTAAARARTFRTWPQYAAELKAWMQTLPRNGNS